MDQNNMNGMNFVMGDEGTSGGEEVVNNVQTTPTPVSPPLENTASTSPSPVNNMVQPQVMPNSGPVMGVNSTPETVMPQGMPAGQMTAPPVNNGVIPPKNIIEAATMPLNPTPNGNNQPVTPLNNPSQPEVSQPEVLEPKSADNNKKDKTKKILIAAGVILASLAIGIVIGFVLFNKFGNGGSDTGYEDIYYGE